MFKNYFKTAIRNLLGNKVYSFINISGLTLGLACAMLIVLYIKDEVSYDRFHNNVKHIYRIAGQVINPDGSGGHKDGNTGYFQGPRFTSSIPEIKSFVRVQSGRVDIKTGTDIKSRELLYTDSSFFSVFSFPLISGNPATCLLNPHSIVISEDEAKNQFGNASAMGNFILLKEGDQFVPYIVTAVAKRCPQNSSIKFDLLLPIKVSAEDEANGDSWFSFFLNTFVVLNPDANVKAVESKMKQVYETEAKEAIKAATEKYGSPVKFEYLLQPFADMHLDKDLPAQNGLSDASNPMYSYILSGIALFILLIACINFVNLTVARSVGRAREIGIRKVVGGDRKQLIVQFLGESFLLCLLAFILAILLVHTVLPVFNNLSNKALSLSYLLDTKLTVAYLILFFITGLLAGFYPALVLSGYNPVQTLYSRFALTGKSFFQKGLVVLQFALASFLIIATLAVFKQFNFLTTEKLGFDNSNLITINKSGLKRGEAKLFKEQLMENPDIIGVAAKNRGGWFTSAKLKNDSTISFHYETIDETFLPLLKIPVIKGRNFSLDFPSDSGSSVLVNEAFVKKAQWANPIGQEVNFWHDNNKKYTVVGVVKDYHSESLNQVIGPQLFTMKSSNNYGTVFIKIRPNSETTSLRHIAKVFKNLFPISPYSYVFKNEENLKNYESEARWRQIMLFGAIITIFISCIGLFGLSVLSAEKRTKEIGIRKVLGASVSSIATILSIDFLKLVFISLILSMPLGWMAAGKWLENYPYRISLSWDMFSAAGFLIIALALFTISFQAVKAGLANPVRSLRAE
jgi:putative ABC transport system permease protein